VAWSDLIAFTKFNESAQLNANLCCATEPGAGLSRRGTGTPIVALARKCLGIIYRTLKNKWVFEDFPDFVLAEDATA
jgi:hypothetical protein